MILFGKTGELSNSIPGRTYLWEPVMASILRPRVNTIPRTNDLFTDLSVVNSIANKVIKYKIEVGDKWATVEETLSTKQGDCEDYCSVKWSALHDMGYPDSLFSVAAIRDTVHNDYHAVLVCSFSGINLILDNKEQDIYEDITKTQYIPVYSYAMYGGYIF